MLYRITACVSAGICIRGTHNNDLKTGQYESSFVFITAILYIAIMLHIIYTAWDITISLLVHPRARPPFV